MEFKHLLKDQKLLGRTGQVVSTESALSDKRIVLFYFSAGWCPPCRAFTPILNEFYTDLLHEEESIEVVFVSADETQEEMLSYMNESHGNWLAVQHGSALAKYRRINHY